MVLIILKIAYKKDVYDNINFYAALDLLQFFLDQALIFAQMLKKLFYWDSNVLSGL